MPVVVIDTIKPKNNLTFPIVEDVDVLIKASSKRLSEVVATMATQADIEALQAAVNGKASQADLTALSNTVEGKQDTLSSTQLTAVNSGITSELVAQITANATAIAGKADSSDLTALSATVATKANASDVSTADANLQAQIDNIVSGSTADSEVINARVGTDSTSYTTLKERLDTENSAVTSSVNKINNKGVDIDNISFGYTSKQIFDISKAVEHGYYNNYGVYVEHSGLSGYMLYCHDCESLYFASPANYFVSFHDANKAFISAYNPIDRDQAISVPATAYYACINIPTEYISYGKVYKYGIKAEDKFERYIDVTIEKYEKNVNSISHGANLFNKNKVTPDYLYFYNTGVFTPTENGYSASEYIEIEPETTYGLNVIAHICFWDSKKKYISGITHGSQFGTFTSPQEAKYITISVQNVNSCMLTKGSIEIPPEAYKEFLTYGANGNYEPYESGYIYHTFDVPATKALTSSTNHNTAYLRLPESYSPTGAPTKLCILCHGASKGISSDGSTGWTYDTNYNKIITALINAGYAVIDSNGYDDSVTSGHEHWGAPQALTGYLKAYEYFTQRYNLEKDIYLYGFSMGGLTALNLAIYRSFGIKCMMIAAPVISLYDQCVSGTAQSVNSDFLKAYGMTEYNEAYCRGYDRYKDIVEISNKPYINKSIPPIFGAYGVSDTAISNTLITEYFNALHNSNYNATLKSYTGGHEISYGGSQAVIDDMIKYFNYY